MEMRQRCNKLQFKAWLEKREIVKYNSEIESRAFTRGTRLRFRKTAYDAPKIVFATLGNRANSYCKTRQIFCTSAAIPLFSLKNNNTFFNLGKLKSFTSFTVVRREF